MLSLIYTHVQNEIDCIEYQIRVSVETAAGAEERAWIFINRSTGSWFFTCILLSHVLSCAKSGCCALVGYMCLLFLLTKFINFCLTITKYWWIPQMSNDIHCTQFIYGSTGVALPSPWVTRQSSRWNYGAESQQQHLPYLWKREGNWKIWDPTTNRTQDLLITSRMLIPLSH